MITVTNHAVDRYRQRRRDDRPVGVLREEIRTLVEAAIRQGQVATRKPKCFRLYGDRAHELPLGQRIVWTPDGQLAFILTHDDVVLTTLIRSKVGG